ncbi:MAG: choice-of-anchor J domain-containing protein, partial [Duncaniella sp.]|nr:choice-of-anchor J domain-containing protein [Duncaniella sp.]
PKTLFNGTRAFGALDYKVTVDGETVAEGKTTYGGSVEADVTIATAGYHTFIITTSNKVGQSPMVKEKVFVGKGIPAAPKVTATWANGVATLSWAAVTTSADGGYINPDDVTYTITAYPEEKVLAQNVATNIFSIRLPMPDQYTVYTYGVTATYDGKTSVEGVSNAIALGDIVPPYEETFDSSDVLSEWTIIDGNSDSKKWTYYDGAVRISFNSSKDMNDWLISPAIKLKAGQACLVSIDAKAETSTYNERVEVAFGTAATAAAMKTVIIEPTVVTATTYTTYSGYMVAETDGLYYVGIHGISDKDKYYLTVDNFTLGDVINAGVPQKVNDLKVTPGANGALNATVEFTTPSLNMLGTALTSITKMEVLRGDDVVLELNGAVEPGKTYTIADTKIPATGEYTYTVKLYNSYGMGEVATVDTYIGINYPAAPEGLGIQESEDIKGGVTIYWDPITTTETGEPLAASDVTYEVYDYDGSNFVKLAEGLTQTYYSYLAVSGNTQDFKQYAVFGVTARGRGERQVTSMVPVGPEYKNFYESFPNGTLNYIFGISSVPGANGRASWSLFGDDSGIPSVDGDNGFIGSVADYLNYGGRLFTGKISLEGLTKPTLTFYTYNIGGDDPNTISVLVNETCNSEFETVLLPATPINEISAEEGWIKVTVDLAAYKDKTIQLAFDTMVKQYKYTMLDAIKVADMLDYDLFASKIEAPATVATSTPFEVNVTVSNERALEATDSTVELYA